MNKYFTGGILIGIIGLAGCASTAETEAYKMYRAAQGPNQQTLLGTRLVKPTTERMVSAVGNKEYNETNLHMGIANRFRAPGE